MYSYIKGTLEEISPERIVVENHGIGYEIRIPASVLDRLPPRGGEIKVYTYLYVREDNFSLFGFLTRDDLALFQLLINVSGIGPKGGLALLSVLSADDIRFAIVSEDAKTISRAPGIGPKTAKRLIIELKDKVDLEDALSLPADPGLSSGVEDSHVRREAAEALEALGYSPSDAAKVLSGIEISEESDVEDVLKTALKQMAFL